LFANTQPAGGDGFMTLSVGDLQRLFTALESRPPSRRWVFCVMAFLQAVQVVECRPQSGQSNAWRLRPTADWLTPEQWPTQRRAVYSAPVPRRKTQSASTPASTKVNTAFGSQVIYVKHWQQTPANENDAADPLACTAARTFHAVFGRQPTLHFAEHFLVQISTEADLVVWQKVLDWYNFRYRRGNQTPRPDTVWNMFLDWRDNPHKVLDVPTVTLPTATGTSEKAHGNLSRNGAAAADTLGLFDDSSPES
jgi:hypothetical protein